MLSQRIKKEIRALHSRKGRDVRNACLVEGERSVSSALDARATFSLVVYSTPFQSSSLLERLRDAGVELVEADDREMRDISDVQSPQGVIGVAENPMVDENSILKLSSVLILDGIQDPGNAGTLIRAASWFGIDAVLGAPGTVDLISPKVVRATMGGLWEPAIAQSKSLSEWLRGWHQMAGRVVAADLAGQDYRSWTPSDKMALVIGSEAHGLSPAVRPLMDEFVRIERFGDGTGTESLNASIAGGILLAKWRN